MFPLYDLLRSSSVVNPLSSLEVPSSRRMSTPRVLTLITKPRAFNERGHVTEYVGYVGLDRRCKVAPSSVLIFS